MHEPGRNSTPYETTVDDNEALRLQIAQEASQNEEASTPMVDSHEKVDPEAVLASVVTAKQNQAGEDKKAATGTAFAPVEKPQETAAAPPESQMDKIMAALQGGLGELRTATLSRQEISKIEDLLYDFKKELYNVESRGRERA